MRFESLIFDIDGTLWDSRALVAEGYNLQLREEGLERYCVDAERLRSLFGKVMTAIADELFPDMEPEVRYPLMARCMERENRYLQQNACRIGYPEIQETIRALAAKHRLFIVSNSQRGYPELCMEKLGLESCFCGHMCFGDTGTGKGRTILTLMKRYQIRSCAYVGDTQGDMEASREAGIPFVWAAYGFGTPEIFDLRIDSPADLIRLDKEGLL